MKRYTSFRACFASSAFLAVLFFVSTCVHAIVIDHECTDVTAIPQSAIEQAKSTLHIAYGHTSHGSQLTTGMTGLVEFANGGGLGLSLPEDIFAYNDGGTDGALDLQDYAMGGDVGYYPAWVNNTTSYLNNTANADVNVIIWSWCGQVDDKYSAGTLESEYLTPMAQLENDYPGVVFIYMTGHVDIWDDADNKAANQMIRDYCIENDKILYDFADIEHYDPDGTYFEFVDDNCDYYGGPAVNKLGNWATEWQNTHDEGSDWYSCSSAHSQPLNANQKAYAAWWLWATLAGWDSSGETDTWNVTFTAGTGGSLSGETEQVVEDGGSTTAVEAVADSGYEFSGWTGDYVDTDNPLIITGVVSDMIVDSVFTDIDADDDGVIDSEDLCPGHDDTVDVDGDGTPDGCDSLIDSDNDGVGDSEDLCPGHDDTVDVDSDGTPDGCDSLIDIDGDGYGIDTGDFNDNDDTIYPGAPEICGDGIDQDCDGSDLACGPDPDDIDNDGDGYTENQGDLNDVDDTIYPGAPEICGDGIDQDCDGSDLACGPDPDDIDNDEDGYTENQGDLNDDDDTIYPGAPEICGDGIDQDCDGSDLSCPPDTEITDEDSDGIGDDEEAGPDGDDFNYDGNSDGIPDYEQSNVASFYDVKGHYVTMAATAPAILTDVVPTNQESALEDTEFPYGLFSFTVEGESNPVVTIILPEDVLVDTYYKYGPTPDDADPHWYEFMYDEESKTGAVINDQTITLYFVDGERGDDDLNSTNLAVIDVGGPAVISAVISDDPSGDDASSGGEGFSGDDSDSDDIWDLSGCFITSFLGERQTGNLFSLIVLAIVCAGSCIRRKVL